MDRYQVKPWGEDFAVLDTKNGEWVLTGRNEIYSAPEENALWTAQRLNSRNDWTKGGQ